MKGESKPITWQNEIGVQMLVKDVLEDVVRIIGLRDQITIAPELTIQSARADMWILANRGIPIGVVEVKRPPTTRHSHSVLDNENVLGQLFDYMKRLENFFGLQNIFGILTNYESWRLCWFAEGGEAALSSTLPSTLPDHHLPNFAPTTPLKSSAEDDLKGTKDVLFSPAAKLHRALYGTPPIAFNDPNLIPSLASVL